MEINKTAMDFCSQLQRNINALENISYENDPKKHDPLKPIMLWIRDECRIAKMENLMVRRAALKEMIEKDHHEIQNSLLKIGMGFVPTHP